MGKHDKLKGVTNKSKEQEKIQAKRATNLRQQMKIQAAKDKAKRKYK